MTLKFELDRAFCTVHLPTKFYHPLFNRSAVIVLSNKQTNKPTNKQADLIENIHIAALCYAGGEKIRNMSNITLIAYYAHLALYTAGANINTYMNSR